LLENIDSRIYLYYTNFDNIDNREIAPSSYLLQLYRSLENDDTIDYGDFKDEINEINTFIPEDNNEILSEKEKWLFYDRKSKIKNMDDIFLNQYSNIVRGEKALAKMKEGFNKFNGNININPVDVDPRLNDKTFSVSRLESIAKCPYGYFLNYILGIEPPEDKEFDNENWLDPLQRGSLLHSIYEKFYKKITENGEKRVKYSKHKKLMDSIVDREVEQLKKEVIPPSELVYESEVEEIKNSTDLFLKMEEENDENLKPVYFEFKFGFNYGENNSEEVKLNLPSGKSIKLRGKIDRIDKIDKDLYNIIDYKTGSTYSYNNNDYFNQGSQLQHAVYALAFEKLMDNEVEVNKSIYYFPTLKGEGIKIIRLKDGLNKREDVKELIDNLLDIIAKGNFSMSKCDYNTNPCKYCDYNQICSREKYDEINDLIKDEDIEELDIVRRLEQYD
ncbi:MAG: PD-(D/E)XK nuclease family protein, partial [Bacillota bacterium]